ncbi:MAG: hypothetical protein OR994_02225 [Candidatus Poseidoniales archaeon]|nr:hypothetical protein [Candidatus Poseidoniales archaeon]
MLCISMIFSTGVETSFLENEENTFNTQSQQLNPSEYIIDRFVSVNNTDDSNVISLDSKNNKLAGCADYSGSLSSQVSSKTFQSNGSKDIYLFGWDEFQGYWETSIGGTALDFCYKIRWTNSDNVLVSGSFNQSLQLGTHTLSSLGENDGFAGIYNPVLDTWVSAISLGGLKNDNFLSSTVLSNGSFVFIGNSESDIRNDSNEPLAQSCHNQNDFSCSFVLYTDSSLAISGMQYMRSTANIICQDAVEIGTSGKLLLTGYFQGTFIAGRVSQGSNDIFVIRIDEPGEFSYIQTFGGPASDIARHIVPGPSGFVVAGETTSTLTNPSSVQTSNGWVAPPTAGNKDILLLKISTTGVMVDGLIIGTAGSDGIGEISTNSEGTIHLVGYIGSTIINPATNISVGTDNTKSAILISALLNGGNQTRLIDVVASQGPSGTDSRANAIAIMGINDIWIGGRMSPGTSGSTLLGFSAQGGISKAGFHARLGADNDLDNIVDRTDNCPEVYNDNQFNYDGDAYGDLCDSDIDDDGALNDVDACDYNQTGWFSNEYSDYDNDGCRDIDEDFDDDNDGVLDTSDDCTPPLMSMRGNVPGWMDHDSDGCHDDEDDDDDNDGVIDSEDTLCQTSINHGFISTPSSDYDGDGCEDASEDDDDDADGVVDILDACDPESDIQSIFNWSSTLLDDHDSDGCKDSGPQNGGYGEDTDDDNDDISDANDGLNGVCRTSDMYQSRSDYDSDGCLDIEDFDGDNDGVLDSNDNCKYGSFGDLANDTHSLDFDGDGCADEEDPDDDNDGINDGPADKCLSNGFVSSDVTDFDGDGCEDSSDDDLDDDNDGIPDDEDDCDPDGPLAGYVKMWSSTVENDYDGDGCLDSGNYNNGFGEDEDDDNDGVLDRLEPVGEDGKECLLSPPNGKDSDRDGCVDINDPDKDGNGILDTDEDDEAKRDRNVAIVIGVGCIVAIIIILAILVRGMGRKITIDTGGGDYDGVIAMGLKHSSVVGGDDNSNNRGVIQSGDGNEISNGPNPKDKKTDTKRERKSSTNTESKSVFTNSTDNDGKCPDDCIAILFEKDSEHQIDIENAIKVVRTQRLTLEDNNHTVKALAKTAIPEALNLIEEGWKCFVAPPTGGNVFVKTKQFKQTKYQILRLSTTLQFAVENLSEFVNTFGKNSVVTKLDIINELLKGEETWSKQSAQSIRQQMINKLEKYSSCISFSEDDLLCTIDEISLQELRTSEQCVDEYICDVVDTSLSTILVINKLTLSGEASGQIILKHLEISPTANGYLFVLEGTKIISANNTKLKIINVANSQFNEAFEAMMR